MRLGLYGMIAVAVASFYVYGELDKRLNFRPIDARVSSVREQCYMEKTEGSRSSTSDLLPCELTELLARHHPKWQGADIKHKIEIRFAYISPVDGAAHESNLQLAAYPDNRQLSSGDIFPVQASRKEANRTRVNDWVDRWLGRHAPRHGSI
ncbi:hypothetical protein [Bradyrhizobium elkanii]|uniref:hypothetical protein n=1 Tax=Bradyrhizobium elkanii TaxID=29448 RepID=UPI0004AFB35B|nr:hypothetical protein [Bradyrhizobium elkanii]WLA78505.1 hypothetical protein QNJ99_23990 [Bradyrhizobium elkanii]